MTSAHHSTLLQPVPDELANAAWSQWSVNGHDVLKALRLISERHFDHEIRHLARVAAIEARMFPLVLAAFESVCWQREREAR